jgi:basic amino acid/polyamine antiporter, APA family
VTDPESRLTRRLTTADAVVLGLGAMVGTGVFVVWAPAAERAGPWLMAGLGLAAVVAFCNAASSAQLAAVHPRSGGAYVYGRERLGSAWGAAAGYAFVAGKVASCAAAALAVGTYLWPDQARAVGVVAAVAVTAVNLAGVTKTARATRWLLAAVLAVLGTAVVAALAGDRPDPQPLAVVDAVGPLDVLGAAALLFFAFAGYARIATLGEEVRDPRRTIPRAVPIALVAALLLYLVVGATLLVVLGPDRTAATTRPLVELVEVAGAPWLAPVVVVGAGIAALGALLSLVAGVSRTAFAMAAEGDLPRALDAVHPNRKVPHRAEVVVGMAVVAVVLTGGLVGAVAFSAFTVLLYYAVTNAAALRLRPDERLWPRAVPVLGLAGCVVLAATLPPATVALGLGWLLGCLAVRAAVRRRAEAVGQ